MPDQRQLSPRRVGPVSPLAVRSRSVPRHIRCSLAYFLRAAVVAIDAIRALLVPIRRSRSDLSGDAAMDTANRDDAWRGGAVLLHGANARGRRCPLAHIRKDDGGRQ